MHDDVYFLLESFKRKFFLADASKWNTLNSKIDRERFLDILSRDGMRDGALKMTTICRSPFSNDSLSFFPFFFFKLPCISRIHVVALTRDDLSFRFCPWNVDEPIDQDRFGMRAPFSNEVFV